MGKVVNGPVSCCLVGRRKRKNINCICKPCALWSLFTVNMIWYLPSRKNHTSASKVRSWHRGWNTQNWLRRYALSVFMETAWGVSTGQLAGRVSRLYQWRACFPLIRVGPHNLRSKTFIHNSCFCYSRPTTNVKQLDTAIFQLNFPLTVSCYLHLCRSGVALKPESNTHILPPPTDTDTAIRWSDDQTEPVSPRCNSTPTESMLSDTILTTGIQSFTITRNLEYLQR